MKLVLSSKKLRPDLTTEASQTALSDAVIHGYGKIVELLLEVGADINLTNKANALLVGLAITQKNEAIVRKIIEFNSNLNIQDADGDIVLHFIRQDTPLASVRLAVSAGAKLDTVKKRRNSPLCMTTRFSALEAVEYLISKNAEVISIGTLPPGLCMSMGQL